MNSGIDHETKKEGTHILINKIELKQLKNDAEKYRESLPSIADITLEEQIESLWKTFITIEPYKKEKDNGSN